MSSSYNEWESDLSSIIEKTNQNLKLLRRIGEKKADFPSGTSNAFDVSTTARPSLTSAHSRYAAEDAASISSAHHRSRPRVLSTTGASSSRRHGDIAYVRGGSSSGSSASMMRSTTIVPPPPPPSTLLDHHYDHERPTEELIGASSRTRRSNTQKPKAVGGATTSRIPDSEIPGDIPTYVLDDVKKSLEVQIASRSSAFEKKLADLQTDFTVLTNETTTLSQKFGELRDSVMSKMSHVPSVLQTLQENTDAITRLEKHSAVLLGWKVSIDQDMFEISTKMKAIPSVQDKTIALEHNLESLSAAFKNRPRYEQQLEELNEKISTVQRQQSNFADMKAVEHLLNIRLSRDLHELESRVTQNVAFLTEKVEQKLQAFEKMAHVQRNDALFSLKNELLDDIQRINLNGVKKSDLLPLHNAQGQLKEDLNQFHRYLDRQDKKIQDVKQNATQIREELVEARQELSKAVQTQQKLITNTLDEKVAELSTLSKEKNAKVNQQLTALSNKQKKMEENVRTLHESIAKTKYEVLQKQTSSLALQQRDNDKLRHRLARYIAELETIGTAKAELERHYEKQEKQYQAKLADLRTKVVENEKEKEAQRVELTQKIQQEATLMGVAQGKNSLLESLLAKEKLENEEKSRAIQKSRHEMSLIRQKMRSLEIEIEKKMQKLSTDLQSKQVQVDLLVKKLKKSEEDVAKMAESAKRDANAVRQVKLMKDHEVSIAKLRLKEMELAMLSTSTKEKDTEVRGAAGVIADTDTKRKEMETLLRQSQVEMDALKQEMEDMSKEYKLAKETQSSMMEAKITQLAKDYEDRIDVLNNSILNYEKELSHLQQNLVEKSNLEALEDELRSLRGEKNSLAVSIQRAQIEHERVLIEKESSLRIIHQRELTEIKNMMETRVQELDESIAALGESKTRVNALETQLREQEVAHADKLSTMMEEITETRVRISSLTKEVLELKSSKSQLESTMAQLEAQLRSESSDKDEQLAHLESKNLELGQQIEEMSEKTKVHHADLDAKLQRLLAELEEKEGYLKEARAQEEKCRHELLDMVTKQEDLQRRYANEIETLSCTLERERENSKEREDSLEANIALLKDEINFLKAESQQAIESNHAELTAEISELNTALQESRSNEQHLQQRLERIVHELTNVEHFQLNGEDQKLSSENEIGIMQHLAALRDSRVTIAAELEQLQSEYEMVVANTASDRERMETLESQISTYNHQIQDLQRLVDELQTELKQEYAKSAAIADNSGNLEHEITRLRDQVHNMELQADKEIQQWMDKKTAIENALLEKQDEVETLRCTNEKLSSTIQNIRNKMNAIEENKYAELCEFTKELSELEEYVVALHEDDRFMKSNTSFDGTYYSNHQKIMTMAQEIRSLYVKLTKSCGVLEWNDLRASVFEEEERVGRLLFEKIREVTRLQSVEQEILLNADFLNALVSQKLVDCDDDSRHWIRTYANTTPDLVEKLQRLEERLREAVENNSAVRSEVFNGRENETQLENEMHVETESLHYGDDLIERDMMEENKDTRSDDGNVEHSGHASINNFRASERSIADDEFDEMEKSEDYVDDSIDASDANVDSSVTLSRTDVFQHDMDETDEHEGEYYDKQDVDLYREGTFPTTAEIVPVQVDHESDTQIEHDNFMKASSFREKYEEITDEQRINDTANYSNIHEEARSENDKPETITRSTNYTDGLFNEPSDAREDSAISDLDHDEDDDISVHESESGSEDDRGSEPWTAARTQMDDNEYDASVYANDDEHDGNCSADDEPSQAESYGDEESMKDIDGVERIPSQTHSNDTDNEDDERGSLGVNTIDVSSSLDSSEDIAEQHLNDHDAEHSINSDHGDDNDDDSNSLSQPRHNLDYVNSSLYDHANAANNWTEYDEHRQIERESTSENIHERDNAFSAPAHMYTTENTSAQICEEEDLGRLKTTLHGYVVDGEAQSEHEEDDMDEVERLLLCESSMDEHDENRNEESDNEESVDNSLVNEAAAVLRSENNIDHANLKYVEHPTEQIDDDHSSREDEDENGHATIHSEHAFYDKKDLTNSETDEIVHNDENVSHPNDEVRLNDPDSDFDHEEVCTGEDIDLDHESDAQEQLSEWVDVKYSQFTKEISIAATDIDDEDDSQDMDVSMSRKEATEDLQLPTITGDDNVYHSEHPPMDQYAVANDNEVSTDLSASDDEHGTSASHDAEIDQGDEDHDLMGEHSANSLEEYGSDFKLREDTSTITSRQMAVISGRSALMKHMTFSRAQELEDEDDLDEVEYLLREQEKIRQQKGRSDFSNYDHNEHTFDGVGTDDELIDSESEEDRPQNTHSAEQSQEYDSEQELDGDHHRQFTSQQKSRSDFSNYDHNEHTFDGVGADDELIDSESEEDRPQNTHSAEQFQGYDSEQELDENRREQFDSVKMDHNEQDSEQDSVHDEDQEHHDESESLEEDEDNGESSRRYLDDDEMLEGSGGDVDTIEHLLLDELHTSESTDANRFTIRGTKSQDQQGNDEIAQGVDEIKPTLDEDDLEQSKVIASDEYGYSEQDQTDTMYLSTSQAQLPPLLRNRGDGNDSFKTRIDNFNGDNSDDMDEVERLMLEHSLGRSTKRNSPPNLDEHDDNETMLLEREGSGDDIMADAFTKSTFDENKAEANEDASEEEDATSAKLDDSVDSADRALRVDQFDSRPFLARYSGSSQSQSLPKLSGKFALGRRYDDDDDIDDFKHSSLKDARGVDRNNMMDGAEFDDQFDDEFGEELMQELPPQQHKKTELPFHISSPQLYTLETEEPNDADSHHADDAEQDPDGHYRHFTENHEAESSGSTHIPIFSGSSLVERVASGKLPSMLQSSYPHPVAVANPQILSDTTHEEEQELDQHSEDGGEEEYLDESFDLEESLHEEDED